MKRVKSFEHVLEMVAQNDLRYDELNLSEFEELSSDQLSQLNTLVATNSVITNVCWNPNQEREAQENKDQIEITKKIIENFNRNHKVVTDYEYALLSKHVYEGGRAEEDKILKEGLEVKVKTHQDSSVLISLDGWTVYKVFKYEISTYYSVAYINEYKHQIVLAHQGSVINLSDLKAKYSDLKDDIEGVLGGAIIEQQVFAYGAMEKMVEYIKEQKQNGIYYELSTTGYGLGAWLAELSVYFCWSDLEHKNIRAVTFDSPGSLQTMQILQPNVPKHQINIKMLNIVNYLSVPNLINICNEHVGTVYRVFPEINFSKELEMLKKLGQLLGVQDKINAFLSVAGHDLSLIIDTFDAQTGKPKKYVEVKSWPHLEYSKIDSGDSLISRVINVVSDYILPQKLISKFVSNKVKHWINEYTVGSIIKVLDAFINGKIKLEGYYQVMKNANGENFELGTDLSSLQQFRLSFQARYRVKELNLKWVDLKFPFNDAINVFLGKLNKGKEENRDKLFKIVDCSNEKDIIKVSMELLSGYELVINPGNVNSMRLQSKCSLNTEMIYHLAKSLYHWLDWKLEKLDRVNVHPTDVERLGIKTTVLLKSPNQHKFGDLHIEGSTVAWWCRQDLGQDPKWVDFNDDGKDDLVCYTKGKFSLLLSTGTAFNKIPHTRSSLYIKGELKPFDNWCIQGKQSWINLNYGTNNDLICSTSSGEHYGLLSAGTHFINPSSSPMLRNACTREVSRLGPRWIDFNGDGRADLACSRDDGRHYVFISDGTSLNSPNDNWLLRLEGKRLTDWCRLKDQASSSCDADTKENSCANSDNIEGEAKWADFNGDGKDDLICDTVSGRHYVLLSTGTDFEWPDETFKGPLLDKQQQVVITSDCKKSIKWADFNGDRKADFICTNDNKDIFVLLSNGKTLKSPNQNPNGSLQKLPMECSTVEWIDLNADNKIDLVCDIEASKLVWLSTGRELKPLNGDGILKLQEQPLTSWCSKGDSSWIDFNGDGKLDLVCDTVSGEHNALLWDCELS